MNILKQIFSVEIGVFNDICAARNGLDSEKIREQERLRQAEKPKSDIARTLIYIMGIVYLIMAGFGIYGICKTGFAPGTIKYIGMALLDIAVLVLFSLKSKRARIAGYVGAGVFVAVNWLMMKF